MTGLAQSLGHIYRIDRELGHGGMATVYLAEDLKHGRRVAIKVLRPELAAVIGAERFVREIRTIAALQHSHILGLIDSGEVDGTAYYVMPFVEGESLRDRLAREKQLPIPDAVRIATEVASALDYAHRHGVIHRDIKPENIMLHDGTALVADFGIALAVSQAGGTRMTETGMSLGTPHYMSPEQAMGEREVTARSDVYALGCVTYEMLLGEPPFTGPTAQAIVAKVVTEEPRPLILRRGTVPAHVEAAVLTSLQKLPADRFGSAAEFAAALGGSSSSRPTVPRPAATGPARTRSFSVGVPLGIGIVAFLLGAGAVTLRRQASDPVHVQASLLPPAGCAYNHVYNGPPQLAPDGSRLAFIADCAGTLWLYLRSLATGKMERLEGTTGAQYHFWSPDGGSLGFFAGATLKRVDLDTRAVRNLTPAAAGRGGSWSPNGTILYAPDILSPLVHVPSEGGTPQPATALSDTGAARVDQTHRNPYFLPDGRHFLFSDGHDDGRSTIRLGQLGDTGSRQVLEVGSNVAYAHRQLLYVREGVLVAQPFDPRKGSISGAAKALVSSIETYRPRLLGSFSLAGAYLVYKQTTVYPSRIVWFDPRSGQEQLILPEAEYSGIALAPDRRRLLVVRKESGEARPSLWLFDPDGGGWARVTEEQSESYQFGWFPDGQRFFYSGEDIRRPVRIVDAANGTVLDSLFRRNTAHHPLVSVSPDGAYGMGVHQVETTGFDILRYDLRKDSLMSEVLLASSANDTYPRGSPDGRLLAYISDRSGRFEVMAAPLPGANIQWQLSRDGSTNLLPAWSPDGRTLYYINASFGLSAIDVSTRDGVRFGSPRPVPGAPPNIVWVDAASDGRLALIVGAENVVVPLTLVTGWENMLQESR